MKTIIPVLIIAVFIMVLPFPAGADIFLTVQSEEGSTAGFDFGSVRALSERGEPLCAISERVVNVSVVNASGRQYRITQRLNDDIFNEMRDQLSYEALTFFCFGGSGRGILHVQNPSPLSIREQIIFTSDASGSDDYFQVQYSLNAAADTLAGNYNGRIIYEAVLVE